MSFHHVAIATRDLEATHRFYTEAMGFSLVKVVAAPSPDEAGQLTDNWARHVFYDTGDGQLFAVWDLHDAALTDFDPAISTGLGLPIWANHVAFAAASLDDLAVARDRWLEGGIDVLEIDHGWCTSIYTVDPNGVLVEWCTTTAAFTAADHAEAAALLAAEHPPLETPPAPKLHKARAA
jgi:catechol 2,3-dioxygenase-like lactoylglutathione lyase family enzyme